MKGIFSHLNRRNSKNQKTQISKSYQKTLFKKTINDNKDLL